jgi:hypothetical protein
MSVIFDSSHLPRRSTLSCYWMSFIRDLQHDITSLNVISATCYKGSERREPPVTSFLGASGHVIYDPRPFSCLNYGILDCRVSAISQHLTKSRILCATFRNKLLYFYNELHLEVSGQLHAPAALSPGK